MSHGGDDISIAFSIGAAVAIGGLWLAAVLSRSQSGSPRSYGSAQTPLAEHQTAPVEQLTSASLAQLKKLIEETRTEKAQIQEKIRIAKNRLLWAKVRRSLGMLLLLPLFAVLLLIPPIASKLCRWTRRMVAQLEEEIEGLKVKLNAAVIRLDFDVAPEVTAAFNDLETAFESATACNAKWDITTEWQTDQFHWRTIASRSLERKPIELARGDGPHINSSRPALIFGNVTGTTVYIYPGFAMVTGRGAAFALVEPDDLIIQGSATRFIENQHPPMDAEIIGQTWLKANKDGSRDRRFSYNRQIPIMRYGELHFKSRSGIDELYLVSRADPCIAFARIFGILKGAIQRSSPQNALIIRSAPAIAARGAPRITGASH